MQVTFKNIGPLKNVSLDLSNDLIVLCGPNNSGKTYAAYSVYGFTSVRESLINKKYSIQTKSELEDKGIDYDGLGGQGSVVLSKWFNENLKPFIERKFVENLYNVFATNGNSFSKATCNIMASNLKSTLGDETANTL